MYEEIGQSRNIQENIETEYLQQNYLFLMKTRWNHHLLMISYRKSLNRCNNQCYTDWGGTLARTTWSHSRRGS